ncbi:hypothetical protein BJ508DRAFT_156617 [Ascobolus immersus RN42]|uniref:Uncharacterized protein n=1 Tax=Ascobolus immersus RN42 TaxID=1160509 RepID=A0A3N4HYQ9_ASCIM|nr:hypothetical protein BJ508DRAFT_156617 [Ascobolus immersus RN42]
MVATPILGPRSWFSHLHSDPLFFLVPLYAFHHVCPIFLPYTAIYSHRHHLPIKTAPIQPQQTPPPHHSRQRRLQRRSHIPARETVVTNPGPMGDCGCNKLGPSLFCSSPSVASFLQHSVSLSVSVCLFSGRSLWQCWSLA